MPNNCLSKEQIEQLIAASDVEISSLLGAAALTVANPLEILHAGREGSLYDAGPRVLGPNIPFDHKGLTEIARTFLRTWAVQLRAAICENVILSQEERSRGRREVDVLVATVVASLTAHIPQLAGSAVLLNILGVMVVRSGVNAFCQETIPATKPL